MNRKVLFVDDDAAILDTFRRVLRKRFDFDTAPGGEEALAMAASRGPYAVVVSDMRMPGMNGVEFLAAMKEKAPDTMRLMLTGNAQQETAIEAINRGEIYRFLNKPCLPKELSVAVEAGIEQHRLITAEKELLEKTVTGALHALSDLLGLVNPAAFGRTTRLKACAGEIVKAMTPPDQWQVEAAVALSQVGCVVLDQELLSSLASGEPLTPEQVEAYAEHPGAGAKLLADIPRLEGVCEAIRYQQKNYDGSGMPEDDVRGEAIPMGARILRVALALDRLEVSGKSRAEALESLKAEDGKFDPAVLAALDKAGSAHLQLKVRELRVADLDDGLIVAQDVRTENGVLVVSRGQETNPAVRQRLGAFEERSRAGETLTVKVLDIPRLGSVRPARVSAA